MLEAEPRYWAVPLLTLWTMPTSLGLVTARLWKPRQPPMPLAVLMVSAAENTRSAALVILVPASPVSIRPTNRSKLPEATADTAMDASNHSLVQSGKPAAELTNRKVERLAPSVIVRLLLAP